MPLRRLALLALVLAVALIALFTLVGDSDTGHEELLPAEVSDTADVADTQLPMPSLTEEGTGVAAPSSAREVIAEAQPGPAGAAEQEPALAHVVGRFVLPSGAPAVGATVALRGWPSNDDEVRKYGAPDAWTDPSGVTDADGRFDLELDPPRAYQFILDVNYPEHAELSWRWGDLPKGEVTDVGEQVLVRTGVVVGRVRRPDGSSTGDGWRVYADCSYRPTGPGADETRVSVEADRETGEFRLEGVPPGTARLKAYSRMANWIDGPVVTVAEQREVEADILFEGQDLSRTITVVTFCRPFYGFNTPDDGRIVCIDDAGNERLVEKIEGSSQSHAVNDLEPGLYSIRIESPLHAPWSRSGIRPGQRINANLVGSAAATLQVIDGATGASVEGFGVDVRINGSNISPSLYTLLEAGAPQPAGGLFKGLIPLDSTLIVRASGYAACKVGLPDLRANEQRSVVATLLPGASLEVAVRHASGAAAAGAQVLLHPHHPGYDPDDIFSGPMGPAGRASFQTNSREVVADANGRARIEDLNEGDYDLRVTAGALVAVREHVVITPGGSESVELRLPGTGRLEGRLIAPEGASFDGLQVSVYPSRLFDRTNPYFRESVEVTFVELEDGGTFHAEELNLEEHIVELWIQPRMVPTSTSSRSQAHPGGAELGRVEIEPGEPQRVDYEVGHLVPGGIELEVTLNGEPGAGLVARIRCRNDRGDQNSGGVVGPDGRLRLAPLFAGEWSVDVRQLDSPWSHRVSGTTRVVAGRPTRVRIDLVAARGRVQVLDAATGLPLPQHPVSVNNDRSLRTDSEGWIELQLTPGRYAFADASGNHWERKQEPAQLEWTAGGPAQDEVRIRLEKNAP